MARLVCLVIVAVIFSCSSPALAEPNPAYIVDRLVLRMTGYPATNEQIQSYVQKDKELWQIAEVLKFDPLFEERLTQFWLQRLEMKETAPWGNMTWEKPADADNRSRVLRQGYFFTGTDRDSWAVRTQDSSCKGDARYDAGTMHDYYIYKFNTHEKVSYHPDLDPDVVAASNACSCNTGSEAPVKVRPWWDPSKEVFTCQGSLHADLCGSDLRNCSPSGGSRYFPIQYIEDISDTFSREPGLIAAKTIVHDRPWSEVLTTTWGVAAPGFLAWLGRPEFSLLLHKNSPPESYPDLLQDPNVAIAIQNPADPRIRDPLNNSRYVWYQKGMQFAGALTTPGFIMHYNGERAYSRQSRETFLCREFMVPEGVKQVVSDEADLTIKPYCSSCHVTLEPLATFWNRFPKTGVDGFFYDASPGINAHGTYAGKSDDDVTGLARIYAETNDFKTCAVKRAFEFFVGRDMSTSEQTELLPVLVSKFESSGGRIWPVMINVIESQAFTGLSE